MATITIKGKNTLDEMTRTDALQSLQNAATTEELVKLKKAINRPELRKMLSFV